MVRRSCQGCGAPVHYTETKCSHCGAAYEPKKKKSHQPETYRFIKVSQYILYSVAIWFLWEFGKSGGTSALQLVAVAIAFGLIQKEIVKRVKADNAARMKTYLEEAGKAKGSRG